MVDHLKNQGKCLSAKQLTLVNNGYCPKIDRSPELGPEDAAYYRSLIGLLSWIFKMSRVNINVEASMLSSHLSMPREGHVEELLYIFVYLKKHMNPEMIF